MSNTFAKFEDEHTEPDASSQPKEKEAIDLDQISALQEPVQGEISTQVETNPEERRVSCTGALANAYGFGTLATVVKTFAWWANQWPFVASWSVFEKWAISAALAGCEYLPLTRSMQVASIHAVSLSLLTAYMEAADNLFRMLQQLGLGKELGWYDWVAALALGVCVCWQGYKHYQAGLSKQLEPPPEPRPLSLELRLFVAIVFCVILLSAALLGGNTGQAYVLATIATGAKTFAWWINQYPALKDFSFYQKWLAGWSIAALIEYVPLIAAFTVASNHDVHLGLMTAYMEALDNAFRVCQQRLLLKPLFQYDYVAAVGMFVAVVFQGAMHFYSDNS